MRIGLLDADYRSYIDVDLALGNVNGGQLSLDLLSVSQDSPLAYDRIWEASRVCLPKIWGLEYPSEQFYDDVENCRGLCFIQACQKLKLGVWRLGVAQGQGRLIKNGMQKLWKKIAEIGDVLHHARHLAYQAADLSFRISTIY